MTVDIKRRLKHGNGCAVSAEVTFGTYATGGESLTPADLGMSIIDTMNIENTGGRSFDYDKTNKKILAYGEGGSHTHVFTGTVITPEDVVVKDNDDAATAGIAVYLHTKDGKTGWLGICKPDGRQRNRDFPLKAGGSGYFIGDSDAAATGGVGYLF